MKWILMMVAAIALPGCTAVTVRPVPAGMKMRAVTIQENPAVIVPGFLNIVRDGFDRHGVANQVGAAHVGDFLVTYTANQHWDFSTYLTHAEIRVEKDGRAVGYAEYHLHGNGGLSPMKWQSVKAKMDPVLDALLANYR